LFGINKVTILLKSEKFQALRQKDGGQAKFKSQTNINDRNSKFKIDRMKARHPIRD